jgi:prepilin-type N-terminal cleavage/methylation domain-containing protein
MRPGFTLIETLVVVAILGILASIMFVAFSNAKDKARDTARKAEISSFGRFLKLGCYTPDAGPGEYDLDVIATELAAKNPQYAQMVSNLPKDPKSGTVSVSGYNYIVDISGKCVLYANLENAGEQVTLPGISSPTPGGGTGVFEAPSAGINGSTKFFQYSN